MRCLIPAINSKLEYTFPGQMHDYVPDFIIPLKASPNVKLILETKGYDPLEDVKRAAAERWVAAVNADGSYGLWAYAIAKKTAEVAQIVSKVVFEASSAAKTLNNIA
jgi:type III restriction enzyme